MDAELPERERLPIGGLEFVLKLDGGLFRSSELVLRSDSAVETSMASGDYTVTAQAWTLSDVIDGDRPGRMAMAGECSTELSISPDATAHVVAIFRLGEDCWIEVDGVEIHPES